MLKRRKINIASMVTLTLIYTTTFWEVSDVLVSMVSPSFIAISVGTLLCSLFIHLLLVLLSSVKALRTNLKANFKTLIL